MSKSKYSILFKILVKLAWQTSTTTCIKASPMLTYFNRNHDTKSIGQDEKFAKYWPQNKSINEILAEADKLYEEKKFIEVYEFLNRIKYNGNSEVKWRIARVLYQTTVENSLPVEIEEEIIKEAYDLLLTAVSEDNRNPDLHKWFAIVCDCHYRLLGLEKRIEGYHTVLEHLRIAHELKPDDISVCYLLGKLCFDMASLKTFKRFLAKMLYAEPPKCSFEEAYTYLSEVEKLSEKKFLSNIYLLGRTCYELKQFYRAQHYLYIACCMSPRSDSEKQHLCWARQLLSKVENYTLGRQVLIPETLEIGYQDIYNEDVTQKETIPDKENKDAECKSNDHICREGNLKNINVNREFSM